MDENLLMDDKFASKNVNKTLGVRKLE